MMLATRDVRTLKPDQLDALREVANIGAGHAATALSTMTGQSIMINVPTITIAHLDEIPGLVVSNPEDAVAVILLQMLGDLTGRSILVFPEHTACRLAEMMLMRPRGSSPSIALLEQSALKECGNILSGAYLNALADFMHLMLLPSPPLLAVDMASAVLSSAFLQFGEGRDVVFCVESEFQMRDDGDALRGYFLLLPDSGSLQKILQSINLA
ncbi:MAG TPA: chemotaxis protein CheC [Gemmatimonadaceae bacterium]|nr:chemotaxis protein CheC [Gemmatimonadaceae bacterium]